MPFRASTNDINSCPTTFDNITDCSAALLLPQSFVHSESADFLRKSLLPHVRRVANSYAFSCKHERHMSLLPYIITLTIPTMMIPIHTIPMNVPSNFFLIAFDSITIDGSERVVTAIINERIVPSTCTLLPAGFLQPGWFRKYPHTWERLLLSPVARRTRSVFQECFGRYALGSDCG